MGLVARLVALPLRMSRPELSAFLLVVMFSNSGNYGLPVVLFAFGPDALAYATAYFVTGSVMTYTLGVFLAAAGRRSVAQRTSRHREGAGDLRRRRRGGGACVAGIPVPLAVTRPVGLLSDAALPMMILVLGMQLERASVPDRPVLVAAAVGLSLVVAPVVALGLAVAARCDGAGPAGRRRPRVDARRRRDDDTGARVRRGPRRS